MKCEHCQSELMDLLERSEVPASGSTLARHLEACAECCDAWSDVREGHAALSSLALLPAPPMTPAHLRPVVQGEVAAERGQAAARRWALPSEVLVSVGFGIAAALVSTLILGTRVDLSARSPMAVAAGATLWTGTFIAAFWLILRKGAEARPARQLALCGLGAMAVFMGVDHFLPLTQVLHYCQVDSWGRRFFGPMGVQGLFFTIGSAYALVPILLLSLSTGGPGRGGRWHSALLAGSLFFFLVAPAIFLQCRAFTVGALASWLAGSIAGAFAGSAVGAWAYRRAASGGPA
jgi:hypothetical protein